MLKQYCVCSIVIASISALGVNWANERFSTWLFCKRSGC